MDLVTDSRALMMVKQLLDNTASKKSIVAPLAQKPKFTPSTILKPFPRALPESQGVSSARIAAFLNALKDDPTLDMHGVLILKNGKMIAEAPLAHTTKRFGILRIPSASRLPALPSACS